MAGIFNYFEVALAQMRKAITMLRNRAPGIECAAYQQYRYLQAFEAGTMVAAIERREDLSLEFGN